MLEKVRKKEEGEKATSTNGSERIMVRLTDEIFNETSFALEREIHS